VRFRVTTVFLSKRRGAIYALSLPKGRPAARRHVTVRRWRPCSSPIAKSGRAGDHSKLELPSSPRTTPASGSRAPASDQRISRAQGRDDGHLTENNQEKAYRLLHELHACWHPNPTPRSRASADWCRPFPRDGHAGGHGDEAIATEPLATISRHPAKHRH